MITDSKNWKSYQLYKTSFRETTAIDSEINEFSCPEGLHKYECFEVIDFDKISIY
jgi:hypothetical protein